MRFNKKNEVKILPSTSALVVVFPANIFFNIELPASDEPGYISHSMGSIDKMERPFNFHAPMKILSLKNNDSFISKFMEYPVKKPELPKRKLDDHRLRGYSAEGTKSRGRHGFFNIAFLNKEKKKGMIASLNKILEKNKATA